MKRFVPVGGHDDLRLESKTGIFYVSKYRSGRGRLFESTREKRLKEARRYADDRLAGWLSGNRSSSSHVPSMEMVCDELEEFLKKSHETGSRRDTTSKKDAVYLKQVKSHFGHIKVTEIDEDFWDSWCLYEGNSLDKDLFDLSKYVSKVLTFAHRRKYIFRKPKIRNPDKKKETSRRIVERKHLKLLRKSCDSISVLYLVLGYECGLRTSEIRQLRFSWLKDQRGRMTLTLPRDAVKANARSIVLSGSASALLRAAKAHAKTDFVFPGFALKDTLPTSPESLKTACKRFAELCETAEVPKYTIYDLRHSFFTRLLLEQGLPVQTVAKYGGTSITMLERTYLHASAERTASIANQLRI